MALYFEVGGWKWGVFRIVFGTVVGFGAAVRFSIGVGVSSMLYFRKWNLLKTSFRFYTTFRSVFELLESVLQSGELVTFGRIRVYHPPRITYPFLLLNVDMWIRKCSRNYLDLYLLNSSMEFFHFSFCILACLACFYSESISETINPFWHFVGLPGWGISTLQDPMYTG